MRYAGVVVLTLTLWSAPVVLAQWSTDSTVNTAISVVTGTQYLPVVATDDSGGVIVAWQDSRNGSTNSDIYAQRLNAGGYAQWTANGVPICTAPNYQQEPVIVGDGKGGAIISWYDYRDTNYDIYAQRVNGNGVVQWTTNGVAISETTYSQELPVMISDGAGGAILTWQDNRNGIDFNIYAQRIDSSGTVRWTRNGVAICTTGRDQTNPVITSDDSGGAIIAWQSFSGALYQIYAQRVNNVGVPQWTTNGVLISAGTGNRQIPKITSDGAGGAIITWEDLRSGVSHVYAQRVNSLGTGLWTLYGNAVCTAANGDVNPVLVGDGVRGAIITWTDGRAGSGNSDIYAQRVDSSGTGHWTVNGIAICTATGNQQFPMIVADESGGAYITWTDFRAASNNSNIYTQHIDSTGATKWQANGAAVTTAANNQDNPSIMSDLSGGAFIAWDDYRSGSTYDIYGDHVRPDGSLGTTPLPVTASAGNNGSIVPNGIVNVNYGANQHFTITPSTGYHIDSVIVDGVKSDSTTSFTFANVVSAHTIRAVFAINQYSISASAGSHGSITPAGNVNVNYGANQNFAITPDAGYHIDSVIVDNVKVDSTSSYTFLAISASHAIRATFAIDTFFVTASAGAHGTILPLGTIPVTYGAARQFSMLPDSGYFVDSLIVDGAKVDSTTSYTFLNVTGSHAIRAVFQLSAYTVMSTAGPHGTIFPSGAVGVGFGSNQVFTITPDAEYHVDSVIVDGGVVDSLYRYTFLHVANNHTIRVVFAVNIYSRQCAMRAKWNLVSLPLSVSDSSVVHVFPGAGSTAFMYRGGYLQKDTLTFGNAYWLKFASAESVGITGSAKLQDSIPVLGGWNLLGSISSPVAVNEIASSPPNLVTSQLFGYRSGYVVADTVEPGQGYWVKVSQAGTLYLSNGGRIVPKNRIKVVPNGELPPAPPDSPDGTDAGIPHRFSLSQNYPNPFNPTTRFDVDIPKTTTVEVVVYDLLGEKVATLLSGIQSAGYQTVQWDGRDTHGLMSPSGMYFVRVTADQFTSIRKIMLLK